MVLLLEPSIYNSRRGQFWTAICVVFGVVLNRLSVSVVGIIVEKWETYYPSIGEIAITLGVVSAGLLAFYLAAKFLPVYQKPHVSEPRTAERVTN
jgi:Ni/Fe-hydrogenase subunit HybB-like protein